MTFKAGPIIGYQTSTRVDGVEVGFVRTINLRITPEGSTLSVETLFVKDDPGQTALQESLMEKKSRIVDIALPNGYCWSAEVVASDLDVPYDNVCTLTFHSKENGTVVAS